MSAWAVAAELAITTPIPNATASAPTRPMYLAGPEVVRVLTASGHPRTAAAAPLRRDGLLARYLLFLNVVSIAITSQTWRKSQSGRL